MMAKGTGERDVEWSIALAFFVVVAATARLGELLVVLGIYLLDDAYHDASTCKQTAR